MFTEIDDSTINAQSTLETIGVSRKKITVTSFVKSLSSVNIFFYSLIWLLILLVIGTISQKDIGLFASQEMYFSSILIWAGAIPLPGARLILMIMFGNLLAKLVFASPWKIKRSGTIIAHFGALVLLGGGVLTAYFSVEGNMSLSEGQTSGMFEEYHARELVFIDKSGESADKMYSYSGNYLKENATFTNPKFTGDFTIKASYKNCKLLKRFSSEENGLKGLAAHYQMERIKSAKEDTQNRYGVILEVSNSSSASDGIYFIPEVMDRPQKIKLGEKEYVVELRKKQHELPFSIQLKDFRKIDYQGTRKAKSFESDIVIINHDNGKQESKTQALVKMNQPTIQGSYIFYQASFGANDNGEYSVFAVVKNTGRSVPYISSIIICIGLLLHLAIKLPELTKDKTNGRKADDA